MTSNQAKQRAWLQSMNAGKRHFENGNPYSAAQAFDQATRQSPQRIEGWVNLGSSQIESGHYDAAILALKKAKSLNPNLMLSSLLLGDALRMLGQPRQALASYQQAVALERNPASLNKLACAMRADNKLEFAQGLYREALDMAPNFTLARVNLATLQIELCRFKEAEQQLQALQALSLMPDEQREVELALLCLSQYLRLRTPIAELAENDDPASLETALRNQPDTMMQSDSALLEKLQVYAEAAQKLPVRTAIPRRAVPEEWPLIEAMFRIPLVNTVADFHILKDQLEAQTTLGERLRGFSNMATSIRAARACHADMALPVKAERHLRHWHIISCKDLDGVLPGHFKYTQNWAPSNPTIKRVEPALASATLQRFISDIYCTVAPGYARAAVVLMAIADLHVFADGNGRVGLNWLNRELEWAGLMPALFPDHLGYRGELGRALEKVLSNREDISPVVDVIVKAQQYALSFCAELSAA